MTTIGRSAFSGCSSLPKLSIPPSVRTIGQGAFDESCSVTTPIIVKTLGGDTYTLKDWEHCSDLKQLLHELAPDAIGQPATFNLIGAPMIERYLYATANASYSVKNDCYSGPTRVCIREGEKLRVVSRTDLPANAIMWQGRRLDVVNDDGAASAHGAKCEVQNADGRKEFVPTGLLDIVNDVDEHVEEQVGAELGHDDGDEKPDFLLQLEKQEQVTIDTEYGSNHRKQMLDRSRRSYAFVNTAVGKSFEFTLVYNATSSCRDGMTHM